jgi:4-hydroxybenzoyl-CoA thioesterase
MAVQLARRVDYPMLDNANIAYFPRIYDLAHRFFEECWEPMCGISYPELIGERKIGFPVVHIETDFIAPLRYGDTVHATIWLNKVGTTSCTWGYEFHNQVTVCVDMDSLESQEIPEDLRTGLLHHMKKV